MSKLLIYSSDEIVNVLLRCGFEIDRTKGSHQTLKRPRQDEKGTDVVVVPIGKREIPRGTFKSILRQANLDVEEFQELL